MTIDEQIEEFMVVGVGRDGRPENRYIFTKAQIEALIADERVDEVKQLKLSISNIKIDFEDENARATLIARNAVLAALAILQPQLEEKLDERIKQLQADKKLK